MKDFQVAIIGGGPAGLAAALTLSRSMIRTVLFDDPAGPRNSASDHIGAFPGMDMTSPAAFRQTVLTEINTYGYVTHVPDRVSRISGDGESGFRLETADGLPFGADRLLLTTGMVDIFPVIEGLDDRWGHSVINCPFCQGYEWKDRAWGIFAHRPEILVAAEVYRNWTRDLILFVEPELELPEERRKALEAQDIGIIVDRVAALEGEGSALSHVILESGAKEPRDCLLIWPRQKQGAAVGLLDLPTDSAGCVMVDEQFRTKKNGIYAAGDLVYTGHQNTNTAIHMGNMAAATMVFDLCMTKSTGA